MNLTFGILGVVVIIIGIGIALGFLGKSAWVLALYILGILFFASGLYLFPATMWRIISTGTANSIDVCKELSREACRSTYKEAKAVSTHGL